MQRAHERIMLITWRDHKTAEWIRQQTKVRDILEIINKAKWTWLAILWGEMTTDGRPSWQHGNQEVTQETEAARRQGGEMTSTNSKNSGIKTCTTDEGGESWERPTSNNGPTKAEKERKKMSD